jgi:hypothetical protein
LQGLDVVYCPRCGQPWPPAESPTKPGRLGQLPIRGSQ